MKLRGRILVALVVGAAAVSALPAAASAAPTLSGSCQFSGTIYPHPPITVIPRPGSSFDFSGTGTCNGTLDGVAVTAQPITITFPHPDTLFDTCELGPDFPLNGVMTAGADTFNITVSLVRVALAGPFVLTTPGNGLAAGIATFTPPNASTALQDCVGSGVATATLAGTFTTINPLAGSAGSGNGRHRHGKHHGRHKSRAT